MKTFTPRSIPFIKVLEAFAITITIAGVVHLIAAGITAIIKHHISYINPLEFLGLSYLFPQYINSFKATVICWIILIIIFTCVLIIAINKHIYISIIRERRENIKTLIKRTPRQKKQ